MCALCVTKEGFEIISKTRKRNKNPYHYGLCFREKINNKGRDQYIGKTNETQNKN